MEMMGNELDYQCTSVTRKDIHAPKINTLILIYTSTLGQILQLALTPEQATMRAAVHCENKVVISAKYLVTTVA